jgi:hypothetical protein
MAVMIEPVLLIEDPRNHSDAIRDRLRHLLTTGAPARPDAKRASFFEIDDHDRVFYVHVSKFTGKVTLLAVWGKDAEPHQAKRVA